MLELKLIHVNKMGPWWIQVATSDQFKWSSESIDFVQVQ